MKVKNIFIYVLTLAFLLAAVGCSRMDKQEEQNQSELQMIEEEPDREIDISLDAYGGVISMMEKDLDGNTVPCEYDAVSVLGAAGEPIVNAFTSAGYSDITPVLEGDAFEGWIEYVEVNLGVDEFGFKESGYQLMDRIYTTEELLALPVDEDGAMYVAKWAGIPSEDYFHMDMDDAIGDASTSGIFAFCGNGGSIHFVNYNNREYKTVSYGYGLEYGQALNDVMGTEYGDSLIGVTKEGAKFTGWTLYMADDIFWGSEPSDEEDILSLLYNDSSSRGVEYALLRNAVLVGENMPTEQLCGMTCYGENYLAIANWSE